MVGRVSSGTIKLMMRSRWFSLWLLFLYNICSCYLDHGEVGAFAAAYGSPLAPLSKPSERTRPATHDDTLTAAQVRTSPSAISFMPWIQFFVVSQGYSHTPSLDLDLPGPPSHVLILPSVAPLEINAMRFRSFLAWMLAMLGIGHFSYRSFNCLIIVSLITSLALELEIAYVFFVVTGFIWCLLILKLIIGNYVLMTICSTLF
jgi:hypothetical protein